jgi:hypothetical protein
MASRAGRAARRRRGLLPSPCLRPRGLPRVWLRLLLCLALVRSCPSPSFPSPAFSCHGHGPAGRRAGDARGRAAGAQVERPRPGRPHRGARMGPAALRHCSLRPATRTGHLSSRDAAPLRASAAAAGVLWAHPSCDPETPTELSLLACFACHLRCLSSWWARTASTRTACAKRCSACKTARARPSRAGWTRSSQSCPSRPAARPSQVRERVNPPCRAGQAASTS